MKSNGLKINRDIDDELSQRNCDEHGPYSAKVINLLGREITTKCPACDAMELSRDADRKKKIDADEKRIKFERAMGRACIPKRFAYKTFNEYESTTQEQKRALAIAQKYASCFDDRLSQGGGLVFCGSPGTGKTHLAASICTSVITAGRSAVFMSIIQAVRSVKATYARDSQISEAEAIKRLVGPDLLVLDEIGVQFGTKAEEIITFEIINGRYDAMKSTILISNLSEVELGEFIGIRILDRMKEGGGAVVPFTWESHRK